MTRYIRNGQVLHQSDIRLFGFGTIADAARAEELDLDSNEGVLVLSFEGELYELNLVGAVLWEVLSVERSDNELVQSIVESFDVEGELAVDDVTEYLNELFDKRLVLRA